MVKAMREVLAQFPEVETAVLYSSRARGTYCPASDYRPYPQRRLTCWISSAGSSMTCFLPHTIELFTYHHLRQTDLLYHIQRVGVVFYERANAGSQLAQAG